MHTLAVLQRRSAQNTSAWKMAERSSGAGSGRSLLRPMVLAPAGVARLPRRNGGDGAVAVGGGGFVGAGVRGWSSLHFGLRGDGARDPRALPFTPAVCSGGLLSPPA